jgi:hypothetical protein
MSSPARDWTRTHVICSREERPIWSVSTVAPKSRTPPATTARVLNGQLPEPGKACLRWQEARQAPTDLTYRGLKLPVVTCFKSPDRICK